jgi:hypothetical protein
LVLRVHLKSPFDFENGGNCTPISHYFEAPRQIFIPSAPQRPTTRADTVRECVDYRQLCGAPCSPSSLLVIQPVVGMVYSGGRLL